MAQRGEAKIRVSSISYRALVCVANASNGGTAAFPQEINTERERRSRVAKIPIGTPFLCVPSHTQPCTIIVHG